MEPYSILQHYLTDTVSFVVQPFGNGLIHKTYLVQQDGEPAYILQEVNTAVFTRPASIAENLHLLNEFLLAEKRAGFFPMPLPTLSGNAYAEHEGGFFRLSPYVRGTHALDSCTTPEQAFGAALQFGKFTAAFNGLDSSSLKDTIPQFHDLDFRWKQFTSALSHGNSSRIVFAHEQVEEMQHNFSIVERFNRIRQSSSFLKRVTHHDTKISNVLFDQEGQGVCVIDLDTVMSGHYISDVGDMCRTYLSPGNEEETDLSKVYVRKEFYNAIVEGYREHMQDQLTKQELNALPYAGNFMIYMQALRFLTDFLCDDVYYGRKYPLHNFDRTRNQLHLLADYIKMTT